MPPIPMNACPGYTAHCVMNINCLKTVNPKFYENQTKIEEVKALPCLAGEPPNLAVCGCWISLVALFANM